MRKFLISIFQYILLWLYKPLLSNRAKKLAELFDELQVSGEYKRHQVYAQLIKEFPFINRRDISKYLESAVRTLSINNKPREIIYKREYRVEN